MSQRSPSQFTTKNNHLSPISHCSVAAPLQSFQPAPITTTTVQKHIYVSWTFHKNEHTKFSHSMSGLMFVFRFYPRQIIGIFLLRPGSCSTTRTRRVNCCTRTNCKSSKTLQNYLHQGPICPIHFATITAIPTDTIHQRRKDTCLRFGEETRLSCRHSNSSTSCSSTIQTRGMEFSSHLILLSKCEHIEGYFQAIARSSHEIIMATNSHNSLLL